MQQQLAVLPMLEVFLDIHNRAVLRLLQVLQQLLVLEVREVQVVMQEMEAMDLSLV
jgi:hypothetical protein